MPANGAWHARVIADEVVSHAFSHGFHPEHTVRLAAYWAEALGGPTEYSDVYGDETSVVRTHSGNGTHEEMDRRAIACFDQALADVGLAGDDRLRQVLHDYFAWATSTTDVALSPLCRRCPGWTEHSALVMGRTGHVAPNIHSVLGAAGFVGIEPGRVIENVAGLIS